MIGLPGHFKPGHASGSNGTGFVPKQYNLLRYPPHILQGLIEGSGDIQRGDIQALATVADVV